MIPILGRSRLGHCAHAGARQHGGVALSRPWPLAHSWPLFPFTLLFLLALLFWPTLAHAAPAVKPPTQADRAERCWAVADEQTNKPDDALVSFNKATGATAYLGDTGTQNIEAIAFGPDRRLYAVDAGQFGVIDLTTAQFSPIGAALSNGNGSAGSQPLNDVDGLTFSIPEGRMYGVQRRVEQPDLLFVIDWQTGTLVRDTFGTGQDYVELVAVDAIDDIDDIAVDVTLDPATGQVLMYGLANNNGAGGKLVLINLGGDAPGSIRAIANLSNAADTSIVDDMEGLAFDQNGTLFGSTGNNGPDIGDLNRLFQIDRETGVATLKGKFPEGDTGAKDIEGLGCLTEIPQNPQIDIEKATNGFDADDANDPNVPLIQPGDPVTWTYVVTNTGDVNLTNVQVTDDQGVAVTCPQTTLAVGESMTCTGTGIAQPDGYANCATTTGDGAGQRVDDTDCSHYFGPLCALNVEKHTNDQDADTAPGPFIVPGAAVTWTYRIANIGNVTLGPITLVDDNGTPDDAADDFTCTINRLNAGANDGETCVQRGAATAGQYSNLATATGTPADANGERRVDWQGTPLATCSANDPSHYFGRLTPTLTLEKFTNGMNADQPDGDDVPILRPGDPVTWTYVVTNTGSSEIRNIVLVDDKIGEIICPKDRLASGETMTCSATGTVPTITNNTGCLSYANLGTVVGNGYLNDVFVGRAADDDASHYRCLSPDAAIGRTFTISWSLQVTNTGELNLSDVIVDGGDGVTVTCPKNTLAVGETMTCAATGDVAAYARNGTASGLPDGQTERISAPILTQPIDGLALEGIPAGRPGGAVGLQWSYIITNDVAIDDVTYDLVQVSLEHTVIIGGDQVTEVCTEPLLPFGESLTCRVTLTGTNATGPVVSIGSAVGTPIARTARNSALVARASLAAPGQTVTQISGDTVTVFTPAPPATIGGRVFRDEATRFAAPDGMQNAGEPGVAGVTVTLHHVTGRAVESQVTDSDGNYAFVGVTPDDYYLVFTNNEFGSNWTLANRGNDQLDSDAVAAWMSQNVNVARTAYFRVGASTDDRSWDAGLTNIGTFYFLPQILRGSNLNSASQEVSQ